MGVAIAAVMSSPALAQLGNTANDGIAILYSIDIGSDWAVSDPGTPGPLDSGDIYLDGVSATANIPLLYTRISQMIPQL
jgi:hypothetical protein